jgi:serine/threonine protein phosphatase PrpC
LKEIDTNNPDKSLLLKTAIIKADANILALINNNPQLMGMGATVTSAIAGNGCVHCAHLGDSRLYLMRDGILNKITKNHTFLQELIDLGDISQAEAECHPMCHVLDQCVGCIDSGIDCGKIAVFPGDTLLLCTDGIYNSVTDDSIVEILLSIESAERRTHLLIKASINAGNKDDATAIVANI